MKAPMSLPPLSGETVLRESRASRERSRRLFYCGRGHWPPPQRSPSKNSALDFVALSRLMSISIDSIGPSPCIARRSP